MKTRKLGTLEVSELGAGCMSIAASDEVRRQDGFSSKLPTHEFGEPREEPAVRRSTRSDWQEERRNSCADRARMAARTEAVDRSHPGNPPRRSPRRESRRYQRDADAVRSR